MTWELGRGAVDLLGLGRGFLAALDDQLDLVVLLISNQHLLGDDTRFVEFVDAAAKGLGALLDHHSGRDRGYLLARGFMGSLVALVVLQRRLGLDRVQVVDADAYLAAAVDTLVAGLTGPSSGRGT